jgi:small subunit ribosomal protein S16
MATRIRLARHGAKKRPFYRIIVTESRAPRDGRRLDQVGIYDPSHKPSRVEFQCDKLSRWLRLGAQPSATVAQLIKRSGLSPMGIAPTGIAPVGIAPAGIAPTGIAPTGIAPTESAEAEAGQSQPTPTPEPGETQT